MKKLNKQIMKEQMKKKKLQKPKKIKKKLNQQTMKEQAKKK